MPVLDKVASALGSALRAFEIARNGNLEGHGPARRPIFLDNVAQEGRWKGGTYQPDQDAAALRAMQNSWVYMMIQRKAMEKSAAKLYIVDNPAGLPDTGTVIPGHDLLRIMRNPNPHMDGQFMSIFMDWWLDLLGNTYLFLAPDADGRLAELWPMPANKVNPIPGDKERFIDYFEYSVNGTVYPIPAEYVYHEMYPNPYDIFRGLSPFVAGMLPTDADSAMAFWNGAFFGEQNVMPSAVISLSSGDPKQPMDPSDVTAVKGELTNEYAAINRKTIVTNAYDMSVAVLGWNAKDMDFLGGRAFTKDEIIQILGGFPGMFDKNATEANATVADNMFKEKTIWPSLSLRAGRLTNHILRRYYGRSHEARYEDMRPINRQMNISESDASAGVLTVDERRKRFWKADPLPDGRGEKLQSELQGQASNVYPPGLLSPSAPSTDITDNTTASPISTGERQRPVLPNPQNAVVSAAKSLTDELRAWRWRSLKSFSDGRPLTLEFKSAIIPAEINEAVMDGLESALDSNDVKAIFTLAQDSAQKGIIRSWRPWSAFEIRLMGETNQVLLDQLSDLVERVQASGTADTLNDPFTWMAQEQLMRDRLEPVLMDLASYGTERVKRTVQAVEKSPINIDWNLSNERATAWARQHAGEMVSNVTQTTKNAVADQVAEWSQTGEGIDGLLKRIQSMKEPGGKATFSPVRAEMIAITEATNTYAGANAEAWAAAGYAPATYKPGAHVKCRCYIQPFKMPDGTKVIVWYTARDERVCTQDLTTPWGTAKGCKDLHKTIVSEGKYLGQKVTG